MRTSRLIAAGAAAALAGVAGLWHRLFRAPLPRTRGRLRLEGIAAPVTIERDRYGVPHITAEGLHDLAFGQGFCHGQDRLWQLELYRRVTAGRLSEIAGEKGLAADRLMRTLGLRRNGEREASELAPRLRGVLEAYCAGVNAAASDRPLPFEFKLLRQRFEPWRPADMLTVAKLLALGLSTNWEKELLRAQMVRDLGPELAARLDPRYPAGNPVIVTPGEGYRGDGLALAEQIARIREDIGLAVEAGGSNNWAVSGERTGTGKPLLAGDPHLSTSMPGIWYQAELKLGERLVRGASLPGFFGIWMGQSNEVAWTFTNVMADVMDLFLERVEGRRYEFEGEWLPLEVVREEIRVKGHREPVELEVRLTHHGPMVNEVLGEDGSQPLALRWTASDYPSVTDVFLGAMETTSGEQLVELMRDLHLPVSNMVWADVHGNIGYKMVGRIPIRRGGCPDLPKPGWSGEYEWDGVVPYDELPAVTNPGCGFIVTANNRIAPDDFPHHITSDYLDGFRAQRIEDLLESRATHDADSFERMQTDVYSIPGMETVHRLARLEPGGQREVSAIERLKSWDGNLDPETIAGTIYQAFTLRLAREFTRAVIGDRDLCDRYLDRSSTGFLAHVTSPWRWQSHLLDLWAEGDEELIGRPWDELALDALRGALDDLEERFGTDQSQWRWGVVHRLDFPHSLGEAHPLLERLLSRSLHAGGAQEAVNQIAFDPNDPYAAIWAPSYRLIADLADPSASRWQQFTGQSGQRASPHYDDLMEDWLEGRTHPVSADGPRRTLTLRP